MVIRQEKERSVCVRRKETAPPPNKTTGFPTKEINKGKTDSLFSPIGSEKMGVEGLGFPWRAEKQESSWAGFKQSLRENRRLFTDLRAAACTAFWKVSRSACDREERRNAGCRRVSMS